MDAYLDIETTGLDPGQCQITVIGVYRPHIEDEPMVQLVGDEVNGDNLLASLRDVRNLFTYNGSRFDLPFIKHAIGVDLVQLYDHHDLMYDCWRCNLKGGLKRVELQLNIGRKVHGVTGWDAVLLWERWVSSGDRKALNKLLRYNRDDVMNLETLREKLTDLLW